MSRRGNQTDAKPNLFRRIFSRISWSFVILLLLLIGSLATTAFFVVDDYTHENAEFCGNCHNMEYHVNSYLDSDHLDHAHAEAGVKCQDCHTDYTTTEKLVSVRQYVSGDYPRIPYKRKVQDEMCLNCHVSLEHQAERTDFLGKNPHQSHWPDLRCGSCHLSHEEQVDYCSRCHENGGQRMIGEPFEPRSYNPWADPDAIFPDVDPIEE